MESFHLAMFGARDVYLTSPDAVTFFRTVYRRHPDIDNSPPRDDDADRKLLMESWNEVAGPLAGLLFDMRLEDDILLSLLDKDTIRKIVLCVYPKPT